MSVIIPLRRQSLAKRNTVVVPVSSRAHQTQFPKTPSRRTIPATKLGVSVAKVVATIDVPKSHHGIVRPLRK